VAAPPAAPVTVEDCAKAEPARRPKAATAEAISLVLIAFSFTF